MKHLIIACALLLIASNAVAQSSKSTESKEPTAKLEQSEEVAKQYLDSFHKTGVPTSKAVDAAVEKARQLGTTEAWTAAAAIANAYANVVDVLKDHYSTLYYASRTQYGGNMAYIRTAADYEKIQNQYLKIRNDAYLELANLYAAKGEKAKALSYAITAVKLSASEPNLKGEDLIKKYIELSK